MAAALPKTMFLRSSKLVSASRPTANALLQQLQHRDYAVDAKSLPVAKHDYGTKTVPQARYGGRYTVSMIPGDGIGPEMMTYVKDVFRITGVPVDFEMIQLNSRNETDADLHNAISSVKRNGCALKGNIASRDDDLSGNRSFNVEIRDTLDLFVNVVKIQSQPGVKTRHQDIDMVLVRQNTEGEYAMLEHENVPGVVESLKIVTEANTERLCRYAFDYAVKNGRKRVTTVHKANIMKVTDGLLLEVSRRVAKDYPEIEHKDMIIDNCCMQLVSNPWQFDVMIMTNLYGTIVSNLVSGLIGGPGILSGSNFGPKYAIFEPGLRNTGASLVGTNSANPSAMINASADLLEHLDLKPQANIIRSAVWKTINEDKIHTRDLGGQASSLDVVQNILNHVKAGMK